MAPLALLYRFAVPFLLVVVVAPTALDAFELQPPRVGSQVKPSASQLYSNLQTDGPITGRREVLQWGGLSLATLLLGQQSANAEEPKTILLTGCNSGIGFEAAKLLAEKGNTLVLANRSKQKSVDTAAAIQAYTSAGTLIPMECNLASMKSIESFVQDLPVKTLDISCLNAGISLNTNDMDVQRTEDGFELTVGTNHLGHFYLNQLLLPRIDPNGRIVVTASGVHDPESPGGGQGKTATLGDLEGLSRDGKNFEMVDGKEYDPYKAYCDSKLCNIFFARELQRRLQADSATKGITVNSFSPGLITTTGLFRYQNQFFAKAFSVITTSVAKVAETPEWGGAALDYMTTVNTKGEYYLSPPGSSKYGLDAFGNQFKVSPVSKEAQDSAKGKRLWELSEKLLGIAA